MVPKPIRLEIYEQTDIQLELLRIQSLIAASLSHGSMLEHLCVGDSELVFLLYSFSFNHLRCTRKLTNTIIAITNATLIDMFHFLLKKFAKKAFRSFGLLSSSTILECDFMQLNNCNMALQRVHSGNTSSNNAQSHQLWIQLHNNSLTNTMRYAHLYNIYCNSYYDRTHNHCSTEFGPKEYDYI